MQAVAGCCAAAQRQRCFPRSPSAGRFCSPATFSFPHIPTLVYLSLRPWRTRISISTSSSTRPRSMTTTIPTSLLRSHTRRTTREATTMIMEAIMPGIRTTPRGLEKRGIGACLRGSRTTSSRPSPGDRSVLGPSLITGLSSHGCALDRNSRNMRRWRLDNSEGLWTRGGALATFGRFLCCTIMIAVFLFISIVLSLALVCDCPPHAISRSSFARQWIRPPSVLIGTPALNSTQPVRKLLGTLILMLTVIL